MKRLLAPTARLRVFGVPIRGGPLSMNEPPTRAHLSESTQKIAQEARSRRSPQITSGSRTTCTVESGLTNGSSDS